LRKNLDKMANGLVWFSFYICYYLFLWLFLSGIPYGISSRFEPAVPVAKWDVLKETVEFGEVCPQIDRLTKGLKGSENCLFINVFAYKVKGIYSIFARVKIFKP
jgi:hypothetical protein